MTEVRTLFEAVRNAIDFFAHPYWRGPKPKPDEVFSVALVGDGRNWRVRAEQAIRT